MFKQDLWETSRSKHPFWSSSSAAPRRCSRDSDCCALFLISYYKLITTTFYDAAWARLLLTLLYVSTSTLSSLQSIEDENSKVATPLCCAVG